MFIGGAYVPVSSAAHLICRRSRVLKMASFLHKMTSNDPCVTFDPKVGTPPMKLGSVVLVTKFGQNRTKDVGVVGF